MGNYVTLKAGITANIKQNDSQLITGAVLQGQLLAMVNELGAGYQFIGVATHETNPGTPDAKVFYIASEAETYTHFNNIEVSEDDGLVILYWDSSWHKAVTGGVSSAQLSELSQEIWNTLVTNAELTLLGNNTSYVNLTNAIELSANGDSLEIKVSNIQDSDTSGFGFSNSGLSANSYYALQLGSNKVGIRATDGTWITQSKTIPSATTHIVKIVYAESKTYLYVDGTLTNTFNYQKTIRISSFGNGGNGTYGYWGGTIDYVVYNNVRLNLFIQELHNVNTTPTYKFKLADSVDYPDGILSYNAQNKVFDFYSRHKQDKYYMFRIRLDQDDSDLVYLKEWRWSYGKYCRYDKDAGTFTDICDTLIDAENEMAMRFANTIDYTGGIHGDERIDISPDSFIKFFADGRIISEVEMQQNFTILCKSFMYMQLSSLHETSQESGEFVSGHPIIAMHYKKNLFQDSSSHLENRIVFSSQQEVTIFHAGMCCPAKGVASFACLPNAIIQEMTGSTTMYYANNKKCALVDFWNPTNGLRCSVEGHTKQGIDDETEINALEVWDRTTDSKYYRLISRSDANAKVFGQGDVIRNTQDVIFY